MIKKVTHKKEENGVITHLKVDDVSHTRQYVYDDLDNNEYQTSVNGTGSKIYKKGKFITTKPNDTTKDNLDELPKF